MFTLEGRVVVQEVRVRWKKNFVCATYEVIQKSTEVPKGDGLLEGYDGTVTGKTRV